MNSLSMLKRLKKLNSTYKTGFEDLLLDVQNNKAKIPFDVNRLLDMKKMLLGEVLLTEKLFCGLESALGKLLKFRIVRQIILILIYI